MEFRDEEDGRRELHIAIGFAAGSRFPCPEPGCGEAACPVHDARERVWRHLNFFQYKAFIHARHAVCVQLVVAGLVTMIFRV